MRVDEKALDVLINAWGYFLECSNFSILTCNKIPIYI